MKRIFGKMVTLLLLFTLCIPNGMLTSDLWTGSAYAEQAPPAAELRYGFEDGTAQGWVARGSGVQVAAVTEEAYAGSYSLKTSGRTNTWNSPSLNAKDVLTKGTVYEITAYVKLAGKQPSSPASTIRMTMESKPVGGSTSWSTVASASISDSNWVRLRGSYTYSTDMDSLKLYVESSIASDVYYLDDVTIVPASASNPAASGIVTDFEDGTLKGWAPARASDQLTVTNADTHNSAVSTRSLLITNRTQTWSGARLNITDKIVKKEKYELSVWVKLYPGEPANDLRITIQRVTGGKTYYESIVPNTPVTDAAWVNLKVNYKLLHDAESLTIYPESRTGHPSFYMDDFKMVWKQSPPVQTNIPSLHQTVAPYFDMGAAIELLQLDGKHSELLRRHFNSITAENEMKPIRLQPQEGTFTFENADKFVNYAVANQMKVRGHALVWHYGTGDWFFKDVNGNDMTPTAENKALLLQRMENHIRTVVGRYKDSVYAWDVVNEVIDASQPDGMRRTKWFEITGLDFIRTAFRVTREVAPNAMLYINEFSTVKDPKKRQFLYNLVQQLKNEGVPIDGVGHQMHVDLTNPDPSGIGETVMLFAGLGLDNHITELDVSIYVNNSDPWPENVQGSSRDTVPQSVLVEHGHRMKRLFDEYKKFSNYISSVTTWGLADDYSWLSKSRLDAPLLFDYDLQAKYAYWGIVDPSTLPPLIQTVSSSQGTPVIDGQKDLLWRALSVTSLRDDEELAGTVQTSWDANYLYVIAESHDTTVNATDAIELYMDRNNDKTTTYGSDDSHYTFYRNGTSSGNVAFSVVETEAGFRIEAEIPLQTAGVIGKKIGFDIRLTDAATGKLVSWNDTSHSQNSDTSKFGVLTFTKALNITDAVYGTPTIDAVEDSAWANAVEITTDNWVQGTSGSTAKVKTMWDGQYLYIFAKVNDTLLSDVSANPWEEDSIELFVDQNLGKTPYYESDDAQYRVNFNNVHSYGGSASSVKIASATATVAGGYYVEAAIDLDAIDEQADMLIGFDVQVNNDENGDGKRNSVAAWNDSSGQSYQDSSGFGVIRLLGDMTPPVTTAALQPTQPNGTSWYSEGVTLALTASDDQSGVAVMQYSADNGLNWINYSQPVAFAQDGTYTLAYRSIDHADNREAAQSTTLHIDRTAPSVTFSVYTGHTYWIDEMVSITCAAADAQSGIAASTCKDIAAPAYTLGVGVHEVTAQAVDGAGNMSSSTAHFEVKVSLESLVRLINQWLKQDQGIANSLIVKLENATKSNGKDRMNKLNAFKNQLSAQKGKALSEEQAEILNRVVDSLKP
ncbi:endo-1,4-beta-xylanase [Paenibacillus sp. YYML68]|uniref:endo-1,4-beta-xylanase n=1 Tax=Paenibacillus sp. YYML68 TaxID=2909250 RepID=UPI00248FC6EE|nr:endo-1,4-beta-xylanase [Paenibacillus sp. YYML68]